MENESKLDAASLKNSQNASSNAFNEAFTNMTPYNKELDDMCYGGLGVSDGYHKITNKFNIDLDGPQAFDGNFKL